MEGKIMQNNIKTIPFKWAHGEETVSLEVSRYNNNDRLYVGMTSYTSGYPELFADITVNIVKYPLNPNEAFINGDISQDVINLIEENELGKLLPYTVQSGYGKYNVVAFDLDKLAEFDPEGIAEFKGVYNL